MEIILTKSFKPGRLSLHLGTFGPTDPPREYIKGADQVGGASADAFR